MNIPENYYEIILNEFKDIDKLCRESKNPADKIYYFSASYGILNRVMNLNFDPTLVFMHQVLQQAQLAFSQRLAQPDQGTISTHIPEVLWENLFKCFSELISAFEKKDKNIIREVLEKISNLSYALSGNGLYLYLRKKLVL